MQTNILMPKFFDQDKGGPPGQSQIIEVTVKRRDNNRCSKAGGHVYHLSRDVAARPPNEVLAIWWLPYQLNAVRIGTLSNAATYMFTAAMNGCSLGFGSQGGDGTCLVSHVNYAIGGEGGRENQRAEQHTQLRGVFGNDPFSVVHPDAYQDTGSGAFTQQATNFGKNVNGIWQFHSHTWMEIGGLKSVVLHCGIAPAVTVPG